MTIRPAQAGNLKNTYSLPNIHGDVMVTTNGAGTSTGTFSYDPFGNKIGSAVPNNTATGSTLGWVGQHEKITESDFSIVPVQMGARVYLPGIGRFASVDPIEGGVENNYVYPSDSVNDFDLSGECVKCAIQIGKWAMQLIAKRQAQQEVKKIAQREATKAAEKKAAEKAFSKSWKKADDAYLKRNGIDVHKVKSEHGVGSRADLYIDKRSKQLFVRLKGGKGEPQPTGIYIK